MEEETPKQRRINANKKLQQQFRISVDEIIRRKAYEIWCITHNPDSVANWLLAEQLYLSGELSL
jgi:hypothetical protein